MAEHVEEIRRAAAGMREDTTTRTGLILPPPMAAVLADWLDEIASSEEDHYRTHGPDNVAAPQPLDAAHGAWTIARAWLGLEVPTDG